MEPKTRDQLQEAYDTIMDKKQDLNHRLSGMTYADGLLAALDWCMGETEDSDFEGVEG